MRAPAATTSAATPGPSAVFEQPGQMLAELRRLLDDRDR
jgi:hypothetical protein